MANVDKSKLITPAMIAAEQIEKKIEEVKQSRASALAAGFVYDFGDLRGIHFLSTTPDDLKGWREVSDLAFARKLMGIETPITIKTDTGLVDVTPTEWLSILLKSGETRQFVWASSFEQIKAARNSIDGSSSKAGRSARSKR